MNEWSARRKRAIFLILIGFFAVVAGLILYPVFHREPTCFDGKMNGIESGVDCGGSCELICRAESLPIIIKGNARVLSIAPNIYEVVAVFENPNPSADVEKAKYRIEIFRATSTTPIKVIEGETYVPRSSTFAIFEGPFPLETAPSRASFAWDEMSLVWQKNTTQAPEITMRNKTLTRAESEPRLEAVADNLSLSRISNIELVALISDESGNIFAASKTFIDILMPNQSVPVVFSWPNAFSKNAATIEILPRILPDKSYIR